MLAVLRVVVPVALKLEGFAALYARECAGDDDLLSSFVTAKFADAVLVIVVEVDNTFEHPLEGFVGGEGAHGRSLL